MGYNYRQNKEWRRFEEIIIKTTEFSSHFPSYLDEWKPIKTDQSFPFPSDMHATKFGKSVRQEKLQFKKKFCWKLIKVSIKSWEINDKFKRCNFLERQLWKAPHGSFWWKQQFSASRWKLIFFSNGLPVSQSADAAISPWSMEEAGSIASKAFPSISPPETCFVHEGNFSKSFLSKASYI